MRCLDPLRVRQSVFVFPSTAVGPMANAVEVPESLRWGHAEPLSWSSVVLCLWAGNEPAVALVQWHTVAGRLGFWQEWMATRGSHNKRYVSGYISSSVVTRENCETRLVVERGVCSC